MIFSKSGLIIESDFEIRTLRDDGVDLDIIVDIGDRTTNFTFDGLPDFMGNRIQFPLIKNIIIRFSLEDHNNISSIHFLRNIDIHSSIVNFEVDYSSYFIKIINDEYSCRFSILHRSKLNSY